LEPWTILFKKNFLRHEWSIVQPIFFLKKRWWHVDYLSLDFSHYCGWKIRGDDFFYLKTYFQSIFYSNTSYTLINSYMTSNNSKNTKSNWKKKKLFMLKSTISSNGRAKKYINETFIIKWNSLTQRLMFYGQN
jgi:hypothetical protein